MKDQYWRTGFPEITWTPCVSWAKAPHSDGPKGDLTHRRQPNPNTWPESGFDDFLTRNFSDPELPWTAPCWTAPWMSGACLAGALAMASDFTGWEDVSARNADLMSSEKKMDGDME